jgi:hypothetical protein
MEIDAGVMQGDGVAASLLAGSNQATANRAKAILCKSPGFRELTSAERSAIAAAFAARGFVVYGKAFDLVRIDELDADLANPTTLDATITARQLTLIEVKSTSANRDSGFRGHFFSMSTAELLWPKALASCSNSHS